MPITLLRALSQSSCEWHVCVGTGGHVGSPVACNEVKLVDVPEMNYTHADVDAKGMPADDWGEKWPPTASDSGLVRVLIPPQACLAHGVRFA
jgi:hypothetical protein